jgi:hypothetical protein
VQGLWAVVELFHYAQSLHNLGDPVVASALPNAGAFANLEARDRCCIESGLIYEQKRWSEECEQVSKRQHNGLEAFLAWTSWGHAILRGTEV